MAMLSYRLKSFLIENMEAKSIRDFDHCLVVSREEARLLESVTSAANISIIENGVDCANLQPLPQPSNASHLLFVGVIGYPPNADAVIYFCKSILPSIRKAIPEVRLTVVGHAPPIEVQGLALSSGAVIVTGFVNDPIPYYADASVCVVPLRAGGGTRLKILEAMALGRPVVTTSIGCEGLEVTDGEHLLIGDSAADFARQVLRLLREPELRHRITVAARKLVERRYDWSIIAETLVHTYEVLASPIS
jgi:glycosyltransferase involved in cell wall biosynthesis